MALRLIIMRHATTEHSAGFDDSVRNLTDLGRSEAEECAKFLSNYKIDKALVSHIKRAFDTSNILFDNYNIFKIPRIELVDELYRVHQASALSAVNLVSRQEDEDVHLFVLGHNPIIYKLCLWCANPDPKISPDYYQLEESLMPPGRIVIVDFHEMHHWRDIHNSKHTGQITAIYTPSVREFNC